MFLQLNNPTGGLGLTTGLLDAAHVADALKKIILEGASEDILDSYSDARRKIFMENTGPTSKANMLRLYSQEPEVIQEREFMFGLLNAMDLPFLMKMKQRELALSVYE